MQRSTLANMLFCHKGIVQPKPPVKGGNPGLWKWPTLRQRICPKEHD